MGEGVALQDLLPVQAVSLILVTSCWVYLGRSSVHSWLARYPSQAINIYYDSDKSCIGSICQSERCIFLVLQIHIANKGTKKITQPMVLLSHADGHAFSPPVSLQNRLHLGAGPWVLHVAPTRALACRATQPTSYRFIGCYWLIY